MSTPYVVVVLNWRNCLSAIFGGKQELAERGGMTAVCSVAAVIIPGAAVLQCLQSSCQRNFAVGVKTREISLKRVLVGTLSKYCENVREVSLAPLRGG